MTNSNNNNRIAVFDVAKGLGILLVVFAHVYYGKDSLIYIYSFHMPLFFVISGFLFDKNKYTFLQFLKNKFFRLICPYIFFYLFFLIIYPILSTFINGFTTEISYKDLIIQLFIAQKSSKVISAPLWFIPCLFVVEVLYYFISKMKYYFIIPVCSLLALGGWLLETEFAYIASRLPWSIDSALFSIEFYALGNLCAPFLKKSIKKIENVKYKTFIFLIIAIVCLIGIIPLAFLNGKISLGSKILNNGFFLYLTGIIGSLGILALSLTLVKSKFLLFMGKNSLCILAVHCTIRTIVIHIYSLIVFGDFISYNSEIFAHTIIPFILILVLTLLIVPLYNKLKKVVFKQKCS